MGTGANRILKIMQKSGKNTISSVVFLTVNSLNPLTFKLDDRLVITKEFYILSDDIILNRLNVGIKLLAFTFNDGQCYFIHQTVDDNIIKTKIIDNLDDDSIIMLDNEVANLVNFITSFFLVNLILLFKVNFLIKFLSLRHLDAFQLLVWHISYPYAL